MAKLVKAVDVDELLGKSQFLLLDATKHVVEMNDVEKKCDVYGDDVKKMTTARLFARFMSRFKFYNPNKNNEGGPNLDAAWAYYENVTLARIYDNTKNGEVVRAQVGDTGHDTKLYPYWRTTIHDLKAFGFSVRMYFSTVFALSCFLFGAGILNLPLLTYFRVDYSGETRNGIINPFGGSAICSSYVWVECENCNSEYSDKFHSYRLDGKNVMRNVCNFDDWLLPGMLAWFASVAFIVAFLIAFFWFQRKAEIVFDEEMQTASDYSLKVSNPPPDAIDPQEWKIFFQTFADKGVACVTIALNNAELLNALLQRRIALKQLQKMLPIGADPTKKNLIIEADSQRCIKLPFFPGPIKMYEKIKRLNEQIKKLILERDYKVVAVFVTFESERSQRNTLHALSTGKLNLWRNKVETSKFEGNKLHVRENANSSNLNNLTEAFQTDVTESLVINFTTTSDESIESKLRFKGKVLNISESAEPFDIRWKDLEVSYFVRCIKCVFALLILVFFIFWSGYFVYELSYNDNLTVLYIAVSNVVVPKICELINSLESHSTEGKRQESLYVKIALFRCFNSGVALLLINGFIETISVMETNQDKKKSLIYSVYPVICAELFTIPTIKLLDIMGNIRKHILAPRARDQEEMNSYMSGAKFELAERYTDATKILFVALFYSTIMPESYFLGATALMIHFLFGKFCLLRMWRHSPDIGPRLGRLSRNSFFSSTLIIHMVVSAYFWSGYPYDQVCMSDNENDDVYNGSAYAFCNQDMFGSHILPLPRFQKNLKWMSPSQEKLTSMYGWSSLILIFIGVFFILKNSIVPAIESLFYTTYESDGKDQGLDFSEVKHLQEVQAYIPQMRVQGFEYPLIACNINNIDEDLLGWNDRFKGFDAHNLTNDASSILDAEFPTEKQVFSIVKQWSVR
eukprot:CAMPEP_0194286204 /NCGR_PEP_ID=MMETSP0169-20130528/32030_1 /TAXON_ID=218684 /ORGANISM="Corethron pennatum, Strain L29A3" /LENGTH=913 /DNA_ID=CAMNT_0039032569 /DNA_START=103 /DNA_END=2841 /DNA_ORIENTATION=+